MQIMLGAIDNAPDLPVARCEMPAAYPDSTDIKDDFNPELHQLFGETEQVEDKPKRSRKAQENTEQE